MIIETGLTVLSSLTIFVIMAGGGGGATCCD